ncbi:hypothetical protein CMUS01_02598 [Colletotrichum musicola]|uniref:Uncharacterized protein n=1 Tax=Colletotrichum musicola TaxID=2175873 RepID=A0A8H6NUM1_9PEZI|nr:hypothetical protein CMUS01_02598 [Colletotrichum musicola]
MRSRIFNVSRSLPWCCAVPVSATLRSSLIVHAEQYASHFNATNLAAASTLHHEKGVQRSSRHRRRD